MNPEEIALQEVGYIEGKNNSNKYGAKYGANNQPWCMYFVLWCFSRSGWKLGSLSGSCSEFLRWYESNRPKQVTSEPHIGDIVIYPWGHAGIVLRAWSSKKICTIEGNTSPDTSGSQTNGGGVYVRNRTIDNNTWFVTPNIRRN